MVSNYKGRIVEIQKVIHRNSICVTGISKQNHFFYDKFPGGNGTFAVGSEYAGTAINMKIYIYKYKKVITWDIRDFILSENNSKKISKKLLDHVIENNKGLKIIIEVDEDDEFKVDLRQLNVVPRKKKKKK